MTDLQGSSKKSATNFCPYLYQILTGSQKKCFSDHVKAILKSAQYLLISSRHWHLTEAWKNVCEEDKVADKAITLERMPAEPFPPHAVVPPQRKNSIHVLLFRVVNFSLLWENCRSDLLLALTRSQTPCCKTFPHWVDTLPAPQANLSWLSGCSYK